MEANIQKAEDCDLLAAPGFSLIAAGPNDGGGDDGGDEEGDDEEGDEEVGGGDGGEEEDDDAAACLTVCACYSYFPPSPGMAGLARMNAGLGWGMLSGTSSSQSLEDDAVATAASAKAAAASGGKKGGGADSDASVGGVLKGGDKGDKKGGDKASKSAKQVKAVASDRSFMSHGAAGAGRPDFDTAQDAARTEEAALELAAAAQRAHEMELATPPMLAIQACESGRTLVAYLVPYIPAGG